MKGLILAGGSGTRLYPSTKSLNKHLLPVYDKPLIYYPLSTLMLAGIRELGVVTSPQGWEPLMTLLGDGSNLGISLHFIVQPEPLGISDALYRSKSFLEGQPFSLILGDNIFFSSGFTGFLSDFHSLKSENEVSIVTSVVSDPTRFGVLERGVDGQVRALVEKPIESTSNRAVTGLYRLPADALDRVASLSPSPRGELEITDLLNSYIHDHTPFRVFDLPRGAVWFDAGTTESLYKASEFVKAYQDASGCLVGSPEEIAINNGWTTWRRAKIGMTSSQCESSYGKYIKQI